ncbi:unnamed protein product [Effrenium voratum]|nr:unnamed protein product [Effrenium voratum]
MHSGNTLIRTETRGRGYDKLCPEQFAASFAQASTALVMAAAIPASSTRWRLELGDLGELPSLPGDHEGVLRIACGDTVMIVLPCGSTPMLCSPPSLTVHDELGKESVLQGDAGGAAIADWIAEWCPERPGPYELQLKYQTRDGDAPTEVVGPAWQMVVEPVLRVQGHHLPARSVNQLTVLSRLAGPIEHWPESLASQAILGYNMIHFTPIQPPGESGSCYALDDQADVDATLMESPPPSKEGRLAVVKKSVEQLNDLGLLSAMDIVLNHCAGSAPWLREQPESAYNVHNCPYLTAAAELDRRLAWFSDELKDGHFGGPHIQNHGDVARVIDGVRQHVVSALRLSEYFRVDEISSVEEWDKCGPTDVRMPGEDPYEMLRTSLLPTLGHKRSGAIIPGQVSRRCCANIDVLKGHISKLHADLLAHYSSIENDMLQSLRGSIEYERLVQRKGPVGDGDLALVAPFFRSVKLEPSAAKRLGYDCETVAHNGWVMDWPATEDFAAPSWRMVYLRRHLCVWSDTVKLRYGQCPADAPFLWKHMTDYAVNMANIFHAIRLDNAHSTPLHVSQHVLSRCREANPHCWIFAELFTGNFSTDLLYQRTLGINALIREAMQCDSPADLGNKLQSPLWNAHPVGALSVVPTLDRVPPACQSQKHLSKCPSRSLLAAPAREALPLLPRHCPALLFDCTHDNQTPAEKRHPRDALPNAAVVAASCASVGSVRGYDELFPRNPSVVSERRPYGKSPQIEPLKLGGLEPNALPQPEEMEKEFEIIWHHRASKVVARGAWDGWSTDLIFSEREDGSWLAKLKVELSQLPLQYKFIVDDQWLTSDKLPTSQDEHGNRNNVIDLPGRSGSAALSGPDVGVNTLPGIFTVKQVLNKLHAQLGKDGYNEIHVRPLSDEILAVERRSPNNSHSVWFVIRSAFWRNRMGDGLNGAAELELDGFISHLHVAATLFVSDEHEHSFRSNSDFVTGLECYLHMYGSMEEVAELRTEGGNSKVRLTRFPPGSVLVFSTDASKAQQRHSAVMKLLSADEIFKPLHSLSLHQMNYLLYSCESEERDRSDGKRGAYDVPGVGPLAYCGLMGVCAALDEARAGFTEDQLLYAPVAENIRNGDWMMACLFDRLDDMPGLEDVKDWLQRADRILASCPRKLAPFYFDLLVPGLCAAACTCLINNSSDFVATASDASDLIRHLALATVQFWGATKSAPLHWDRAQQEGWQKHPSLCAGLPHFAAGFMRNWGRDTFISLRGCLLATGRHAEARETLLVYASVIRHGLCPNLLDAANRPRYNARDATWFFLQAIQDYVAESDEGEEFLAAPVRLKWPVKDWDADLANLEPHTVADLVHLIFAAHAKGIAFREWGAGRGPDAGKGIDDDMSEWGFDVQVSLDEDTGLISGGCEHNCGTWMDKMGSSSKAGNKGKPATPRDGADVEIIGLLKSSLRWVCSLKRDVFKHEDVRTASQQTLTYSQWNQKIQNNFERLFWIDPDEKGGAQVAGIYRDTLGASRKWQDTQLRPNFCIAMVVAPELFLPEHAKMALRTAASRLIGPMALGMCTLDPADKEYRGDYHNDNDSADIAIAHGWNYHQGPEWVWPLGFFLEAWHRFGSDHGTSAPRHAMRWLLSHRSMLRKAPWRSLPELTNSKGQHCGHSCPAQAWSLGTLLAAVRSMSQDASRSEA